MGKEELRKNSRIMVEPFGWRRLTWKASETPLPYRVMIAAVQVVLRRVSMVGLAKFPTGRGPCLRRIEEHMNCSRRMHDYSKRRIYKVLIWALSPDHNVLCCSVPDGEGLAGLRDADHPRLCCPPRIWGFTLSASPARRRAGWPDTQGTIAVMQAISYPPTPHHSPARPATGWDRYGGGTRTTTRAQYPLNGTPS